MSPFCLSYHAESKLCNLNSTRCSLAELLWIQRAAVQPVSADPTDTSLLLVHSCYFSPNYWITLKYFYNTNKSVPFMREFQPILFKELKIAQYFTVVGAIIEWTGKDSFYSQTFQTSAGFCSCICSKFRLSLKVKFSKF